MARSVRITSRVKYKDGKSGKLQMQESIIKYYYLLVAIRTDAHEGPNKVLTKESAIVGWRGTLIHVLTVTAVGGKCISIRTNAAEGASHVMTSEGTLVTQFLTFVNIFTSLDARRHSLCQLYLSGYEGTLEIKFL